MKLFYFIPNWGKNWFKHSHSTIYDESDEIDGSDGIDDHVEAFFDAVENGKLLIELKNSIE